MCSGYSISNANVNAIHYSVCSAVYNPNQNANTDNKSVSDTNEYTNYHSDTIADADSYANNYTYPACLPDSNKSAECEN